MNIMKNISIGFSLLLLVFTSCESKQEKKQTEIKSVVRQAETVYSSGTDQEWQALEVKFDQLESEYETERSSYSEAQKDSINIQIGRFRALQTKRLGKGVKEDLEDLGKQVEGFVDELRK